MFVLPVARTSLPRFATPSFSRTLDRLLEDTFEAPAATRTPAMDVAETDAAYTLSFDLPGIDKSRLKVSVEGRRVTLETSDAAATDAKDGERVLYSERRAARYARTVSLPSEVDQAASQARLENGVLTLVLAKKVPTGATQLAIQ